MKIFFTFYLAACIVQISHAQRPLTEIMATPSGNINVKSVQGMTVNDSIFLSVNYVEAGYPHTRWYWICDNGKTREANLTTIANKPLFAVASVSDSTYFYYLEENKKSVILKAWVRSSVTGKGKICSSQLVFPGKLYASYTEHGSLFLLCALKGSFTLRLIQITGMQLLKETNFSLSFDLGKNKKAAISFSQAGATMTTAQATASIKLIKDENTIWLTADEPMSTYDEVINESTLFKTSIAQLDLTTGEVTTKVFFEPSKGYFNSTISNDHLFRVVQNSGFKLDIFSLQSGDLIYSMNLSENASRPLDIAYMRYGSMLTLEKKPKVAKVLKTVIPNFIAIDSVSNGELVLTLGNYVQTSPTVPVVAAFGVIGALVSLTSTAAIRELSDGPYFYQYFYLKGSIKDGFKLTNETSSIRQKIDDYEYQRQIEKVRFKYKGYLSDESGVYSIYRNTNSSSIQIIKFEN